ncbi:hypothetical protein IAR55_007041 [Kwoniella newhampshirensis]|uniref:Transcriptional regulatory protein DEP1 n=1 Tax=Kwoniella newhampshirensis TaxID=1651941 RepID=A0AAW0YHL5_9TREE
MPSSPSPIQELFPPRKTSSPLSSPSSSGRAATIRHDSPSAVKDEVRSPATSSTVPLTDEEDDDEEEEDEDDDEEEEIVGLARAGGGGDDESDLTEEDEEEEEDQIQTGPSSSKRKRLQSQASTASLTPPPSDPLPISPLPPSPRVTLHLNASRAEAHSEVEEDASADADVEGEEEFAEAEGDGDGDGDLTMRADPVDDADERDEGGEGEANGVVDEDNVLDYVEGKYGDDNEELDGGDAVHEAADAQGDAEADASLAPDVEPEAEADAYEDMEPEAADSPAYLTVPSSLGKHPHSSHAPPPTPAAMRSLLMLELKFAALRDRLYVERMEEAAAEEEMILNGTHPALKYLYKTLSDRRERLHEVASRRHQQALSELVKMREAEKHLIWSSWTDERDQYHWEEFEQTWSKRRRLAREKNEIETPRIVKPVPKVGQPNTIRVFNWSGGASPSHLSKEEAFNDLAVMETRRPVHVSRHASPAMFASHYSVAGPSSQPAQNAAANIYTAYVQQEAQQPYQQHQQQSSQHQHQQQTQAQSRQHQSYLPARVNVPQTQNMAQNATNRQSSSSYSQQSQQPTAPVQRREGRTVPTTSGLFDGPRRSPGQTQASTPMPKDVKSPVEGKIPVGSSLGVWGRPLTDKMTNGHAKDAPVAATERILPPSTAPSATVGAPTQTAIATPSAPSGTIVPPTAAATGGDTPSDLKPATPPTNSSLSQPQTQAQTQTATLPREQQQHRDNMSSRFASLADYLSGSTAPPGTGGLFGMGMGMGMGLGVGGAGGAKGVLSPPKARSPFGNHGNGSPANGSNGSPTPTPTTAGTLATTEARS